MASPSEAKRNPTTTSDDNVLGLKFIVQRSSEMSILVNKNTRVLTQGLGKAGTFHSQQCRDYGTQMVGGVTPGKGGQTKEGFPLFNTVHEAVRKTGANATMVFVPPPAAADAIMEA